MPSSGNFTSVTGIAFQSKLYPWVGITHPAYGAVGDAQLSTNCSTSNGNATLTCAGGSFAASDVGKAVCASMAEAGGTSKCTTIAVYISATVVTMAANANNTASGQSVYWGINNDAAFAAAITEARNANVEVIFVRP